MTNRKKGGYIPPYTSGGKWEVVEDLKGLPSHNNGGVDISINNGSVYFSSGGTNIMAKKGVVVQNTQSVIPYRLNKYDKILTDNKNVPFVHRILNLDNRSILTPNDPNSRSTHLMSSFDNLAMPLVYSKMLDSGPLKLADPKNMDEVYNSNNYIQFNTPEEADDFARNYKQSRFWQLYYNNLGIDNAPKPKAKNGMMVTKTDAESAKPSFKYPDTESRFSSFRSSLENDSNVKDKARLYYYKTALDPILKGKDAKGFESYTKELPVVAKDRVALADSAYKNGYKAYLSVDEIKSTLGDRFDDYVGLINKFEKDQLGIAGTKEKDQKVENLKYGLRTSLSILPYQRGESNLHPETKTVYSTYGADVEFDPKTDSYKYIYREPKEF